MSRSVASSGTDRTDGGGPSVTALTSVHWSSTTAVSVSRQVSSAYAMQTWASVVAERGAMAKTFATQRNEHVPPVALAASIGEDPALRVRHDRGGCRRLPQQLLDGFRSRVADARSTGPSRRGLPSSSLGPYMIVKAASRPRTPLSAHRTTITPAEGPVR